jgi:prepilin-type N-terminal cleavage/methylation domain-containing protein/prepilin-type processing-associated H-X9-DG protein
MASISCNHHPQATAAGREIRPAASARHRRGFTLVELLVVIAIIGVLAALGATAYQNVRVAANRAKCVSNMRQLGVALIAHAQDNHGRLPATQHFRTHGATDSWVFAVQDYLGGEVEDIRICPADPKGPERARNQSSSYVLNDFLDSGATDIFGDPLPGRGNLNTLIDPARTMMLFIVAESKGTGSGNDHIHGAGWRNWSRVLADIQPDRHRRGHPNANHTKGNANYLFADGRVETIEAAEIKRRIDAGDNIARPPGA